MTDNTWFKIMKAGKFLGCHQIPERSFFYNKYQFPVCARCTGVIISALIASIVFIKIKIPKLICFAMSFVMFFDWFIQYLEIKESTNRRRLITGLIGGFGYSTLHLYLYRFIIKHLLYIPKKMLKF